MTEGLDLEGRREGAFDPFLGKSSGLSSDDELETRLAWSRELDEQGQRTDRFDPSPDSF